MEENPIYKFMRDNDLTQLDERSFLDKYSKPEEASKIHQFMSSNGLTELESTDFYDKYLKKNETTALPSSAGQLPSQETESVAYVPMGAMGLQRTEDYKPETGFTSGARNFLASINQTVGNIPSDIAEAWSIASAFTERQLGRLGLPGADPNIGASDIKVLGTDIGIMGISNEYRDMVKSITPVDQEFQNTFAGGVAQGLGQVTGMMLTGGASRSTQILKAANLTGGGATSVLNAGKELVKNMTSRQGLIGGSMNASANYRQAKEDGASEEDALQYGIENFVVGSILENLPIQSMFSRIAKMEPKAKILDVIKQGSVGFGEEAVTEAMQTTYENMSAQRIYDMNRGMLDGVGDAAAIGGTVGFILNASMAALTGKRARTVNKEEQEVLDKAISETEQKINKVDENNNAISQTVSDLEKIKTRTINDGSQDLNFLELEDGSIEYSEDGLSEPTAIAMTGVLNMRYPNMEFSVKNNTGTGPLSAADFTITGNPKTVKQEAAIGQPTVQEQAAVEEIPAPKIQDMAGESVTVRIGDRNVSGIVEVDEGGKATITEGNRVYEIPEGSEFSEFTRPVSISPEGDFVINGDSFSEARIVTEDGQKKALLIREDGTTKAVTNPRVVEEIEYNIAMSSVDQMTDTEADQTIAQYEQQRQTEEPTEAGTDQATPESEEDRKLREATEEIDLIEQLALMELEDVESQAKLVEFTPKTMKTPSTYLVKKNPDGSYSATLNGRKVARAEIVAELGKAFEAQAGQDIAKLQEQTNRLKQEVEQKLFGRGDKDQQQAAQPGGTQPVSTEDVQAQPVDQGVTPEVQVEKTELAKRIRGNKIKGALSSIDFGISVGLYNSAIEFMAKQVERGTKFGDAVAATIKWIDGQTDTEWNRDRFFDYVSKSILRKAERPKKILPDKVADKLTQDEEGNFVFHHYSAERRPFIKRSDGAGSRATSKEEQRSLSAVGGLGMYYPQADQVEGSIQSQVQHTVVVPKEKVYDSDSDPLKFEKEARERFEKARPGQAFDANYRVAFITQVAGDNGFDMVVAKWKGEELRAQTTKELVPLAKDIPMKSRTALELKVGDKVKFQAGNYTITSIDGNSLKMEGTDRYGDPQKTSANLKFDGKRIQKIEGVQPKPKAIAAPLYSTIVKGTKDAAELRKRPEYKAHIKMIADVADALGINIVETEDTIGGYVNDSGQEIVELSTVVTVDDDTNLDSLEEMAAILASLAPEVQESTIAAKYVDESDPGFQGDSGLIEYVIEVGNSQAALDALDRAGIKNFTVNETAGTVTLLDFSKGNDLEFKEMIAKFVDELDAKGITYGEQSKTAAESRFIDPDSRAKILEKIRRNAVPQSGQEGGRVYSLVTEAIKRDNQFRKKKGYDEIKKPTKKDVKESQLEAIRSLKEQSGINLSDSDFIKKTEEIAKTTEFMVVPSQTTPGWVFNNKKTSFEGDVTMETVKKASPDSYKNTAFRLNAHPVFSSTRVMEFLNEYAKIPKYIQKLDLADIKADIKSSRENKTIKDPGKNASQEDLEEYRQKVEFRVEASDLLRLSSFEEMVSLMSASRNPYTMDLYAAINEKYISKRQVSIDKKAAEKARDRFERGVGTKDKLIQSFVRKKTKEEVNSQVEAIYGKAFEVAKGNIRFVFDLIAGPMRNLSKLWYDGANIISNAFSEEYGVTIEQSSAIIAALSPQMAWMSNLHLAQSVMQVMSDGRAVVTQEIVDRFEFTSRKYPKQRSDIPVLRGLIGQDISNLSDKYAAILIRAYYELHMNPYAPLRIPSGTIVGAEVGITSFNSYSGIEKAVSVFRDGSPENISKQLGGANKIRSFNNNISNPQDDVSITNDTHAMAVAYLLPLAASSSEVKFGPGEYSFFADAYRAVAKEVGMLPREVQSITWEGIRGLFTESFKTSLKADGPRKVMDRYAAGEITIDEARNEILTLGIDANKTEWSGHLAPWIKGEIEDKFIRRIPDSKIDRDAGVSERGEPVSGVLPGVGGGVDVGDGKQASGIEAQKAKVNAIAKDLKDQVNKPNMGIAVDFRAMAESDAKFYKTLKNLVVEYARLKGMEFNEFVKEVERLFNSKLSKENRSYLSSLWKEVKSEIPKVNVMTENKGLTEKDKVKQGLEEILSARAREFTQKLNSQMAKAAEAVQAQKAKLQAEKDRVNAIKTEINKFISDNKSDINTLGAKLSSTILKRVNDAKTELSMGKAIEYMEKVLTDQKFRNFLSNKESLIEKIKSETDPKNQVQKQSGVTKSKKKQTADGIFTLKKIYEAIGMTFAEADARRLQLQQELYNPSGMDQDEVFMKQAELYALDFSGLDQYMDLDKLQQMLDEIKSIKKTDKIAVIQDMIAKRERIEKGVSEALESINPEGKEIKPKYLTKESDFRPSSKYRMFALSNNNWRTILDKLSRFSKFDPHQSPLSKRMNRLMFDMSQSETESRRKALMDVQSNFERIFKTDKKDKFYVAQENTVKKPFSYTDVNGNKVDIEISQNEAYKRWMEMQDESLLPTFEKMGFGSDYLNAIENFMTPEVKAWAEWQLKEFYPKYGKSINKVYRKVFGVDMQLADNYSPIFRERKDIRESEDQLITSQTLMNTVSNGSLKSRVSSTLPMAYMDGDRVLSVYVQQMEFFKNYAEGLPEVSSIMKDPRVVNTIEQLHGKEYIQQIFSFIDDFYRKSDQYKPYESILKDFRKNFTVASLALNPVTFIKQLTSIPAYMNFMPSAKWMADQSFWVNPVKNAKFLYENSRYLQNRYEVGFDRDVVNVMMADHKKSITGGKSFADKMMILTKYGDGGAILIGGWPVYKHYYNDGKKQGMSEKEAVEYGMSKFEEATDLSQQATDVKDFNAFQRGSEFYKILTMYKTSPIQYHTLAMEALRNLSQGRGSKGQNIKQFLIFHTILPMVFQWASMGFRTPDEEEEYYDLIQAGIIGNINAIFIAGDMLTYLHNVLIQGRPFDYSSNIVLDAIYGESEKAGKKLIKLMDDEATFNDVASAIHSIANLSSTFVPQMAPYKQTARTIEGAYDVIEDDTDFPVKRILGWSEWALGENPGSRRQKNVLLEAMYGKDYKKKVKEKEEKTIIL